jgi:hypothetical protein
MISKTRVETNEYVEIEVEFVIEFVMNIVLY